MADENKAAGAKPAFIIDEPDGCKTVLLTRHYQAFDLSFDRVKLKPPTYRQIYRDGLGEPTEWQPAPGGGQMIITNYQTIAAYIERNAVAPKSECLDELGPIDARRLEVAINGFFREPVTQPSSAAG